MNYPETLTYVPDGVGLRWMVDQLPYWLNPKPIAAQRRDPEFTRAINERILTTPRCINEIYESMPARFRTVNDYKNLHRQLNRLVDMGHTIRSGSMGDYKYARK
jgi:hypothetical protein